jgi:hypothetical protein
MTSQQWIESRARTSARGMDNWEEVLHGNNEQGGGFHHVVDARGVVDFVSSATSLSSTFSER